MSMFTLGYCKFLEDEFDSILFLLNIENVIDV